MSLPVILDPEAEDEFDQGFDYYEGQQTGLGNRFNDAVRVVLNRIAQMPESHPIVSEDIRRAVVKSLPYCLYYIIEASQIRIISVFHTSQDPDRWRSRG